MPVSSDCPLAAILAQRMRDERATLVGRWLDRIAARVTLDPGQIFPTRDILDHVPLLVDGIADYLEDPAEEITADVPVIAKAMELGEMRHAQGFDAYQILKEYEILGGVLFDFLIGIVDTIDQPCTRGELLVCGHRIFRSVAVIQQYTTTHYLRRADEQVKEREERLAGFNRGVSHELKNRIGAAVGATAVLRETSVAEDPAKRERFLDIVRTNVEAMRPGVLPVTTSVLTGGSGSGSCGLTSEAGACSTSTWALMPPKPKALTAARRGMPAPRGCQGAGMV